MPDDEREITGDVKVVERALRREAKRVSHAALRIKTEGSCRSIEKGWGVNFGPDSDVDAEIPGSGGLTLRKLKDAGEIRDDCFHSGDEE